MVIIEGHYDPDDYNDPVKYRMMYDYSNYLVLSQIDHNFIRVKRNVVNMLDGSTRTFYTTDFSSIDSSGVPISTLFRANFMLDHEYTQYDQYVNYRISQTGRMLNSENSSNNENIMSGHYFAFYILAQFGGLYAFLHLFFGFFMSKWTEQHLKLTIVNEIYSRIEGNNKK